MCIYGIGQLDCCILVISAGAVMLSKRFKYLSDVVDELTKEENFLKTKIETLIQTHWDLWTYIQELNLVCEDYFPAVYCFAIYETCFFVCAFFFFELDVFMRFAIFILLLAFIVVCTVATFQISRFTSSLYEKFVEIDKLCSADLPLETKLKMLNFMKRFGKTPFGVNAGGFFYVKKNFFIRFLSAIYSALSVFVELLAAKKPSCKIKIEDLIQ
ncbi:uncharacterized protein LOC111633908 [Centruroides sculpturatus]|uniref:uncharacterized protein LOC111633908 n=1 Tax=Centruroides sculpturatus TaxID=218467 RepID=UPI000C6E7CCC|nr:uncharacterized protein LOC111633908 [Centruroides sculpturatus]